MSMKQKIWHSRMGIELASRRLVAEELAKAPRFDDYASIGSDDVDYSAELVEHCVLNTSLLDTQERSSMTIGHAERLHEALGERLEQAGDAPLGIIEVTALELLGEQLGCSPIGEYVYEVVADFESGNITYTGSFENLRQRMRFGVSIQEGRNWMDNMPLVRDIEVKVAKIGSVTFDRAPETDETSLKTTRVSGEVSFKITVRAEEEPSFKTVIEHTSLALDPGQSPAPVQRMPVKNPKLIGHSIR